MTRAAALAGVIAATACASRSNRPGVSPVILEDQQVRGVVRAAIEADAAGRPADSLYIVGATVVLDGRVVLSPPRFAAVTRGGRVNITGLAVEITAGFAWGTVDYRWFSADGRGGEAAKATVILERLGGAWRIKHAQSTTSRPYGASR